MKMGFAAAVALLGLIFATSSFAADMAVKAPLRPVARAATNWTGFYVGANIGGGWAHTTWIDTFTPDFVDATYTASGVLAGGQIGFNYQIANVVLGVEGEGDWANLRGSTSCFSFPGFGSQTCGSDIRGITTVTGRLGAAWNDALLYVKGGAAWVRTNYFNPCNICGGGGLPDDWTASDTRHGWTAGVGVEYAWSPNWSTKLEYDYIHVPDSTLLFIAPNDLAFTEIVRENIQEVKLGVNYRFSLFRP